MLIFLLGWLPPMLLLVPAAANGDLKSAEPAAPSHPDPAIANVRKAPGPRIGLGSLTSRDHMTDKAERNRSSWLY